MRHAVGFRKPKSNYGVRHLPLRVLNWIQKAGLSKSEFFNLYPDYNYKNEGFPHGLIQRV